MLRSIPPANRQHRNVSSMRAATASGYVFVGSAQHRGSQPPPEEKCHVKAIKPDKAAAEERQAYRCALAIKKEFWQAEIDWIAEEFGPEIARHLMSEI